MLPVHILFASLSPLNNFLGHHIKFNLILFSEQSLKIRSESPKGLSSSSSLPAGKPAKSIGLLGEGVRSRTKRTKSVGKRDAVMPTVTTDEKAKSELKKVSSNVRPYHPHIPDFFR